MCLQVDNWMGPGLLYGPWSLFSYFSLAGSSRMLGLMKIILGKIAVLDTQTILKQSDFTLKWKL